MALEDADKTFIAEEITKALANLGKATTTGADGDGDGTKKKEGQFNEDDVRKQVEAEATKKMSEESLKESIRFNLSMDSFVEKNKNFLPEKLAKLLEIAGEKEFSSESTKADAMRKIILDETFAKQDAVDALPDSLKIKILAYKGLAEDEKAKQSGKYYDLVDTFVLLSKGKAEKGFNNEGTAKDNEYRSKFFALGNKYTKKGE